MTIERILIVNVNWLGDVVFSTPIFKALKKAYPQAHITCLGVPRVKEILEHSPAVDEVMIYDEKGSDYGLWAKWKLINQLRRKKFDIAFLLHRSLTRALLIFLAGIPIRVGYDEKGRGVFLTHRIKSNRKEMHRSDYYTRIIEAFAVSVDDRLCELKISAQSRTDMEQMLQQRGIASDDFLVLVNAGGNWDLKRWPKKNFVFLVRRLVRELNVKVVIPGAHKDIALAEQITREARVSTAILAGQTDLTQLMALMQRANLVISADSGPLHIASSVGTRGIGLFGPTRPEETGPRGKGQVQIIQHDVGCNREACYFLKCPDNVCMQSISVQDVMEAVERLRREVILIKA